MNCTSNSGADAARRLALPEPLEPPGPPEPLEPSGALEAPVLEDAPEDALDDALDDVLEDALEDVLGLAGLPGVWDP